MSNQMTTDALPPHMTMEILLGRMQGALVTMTRVTITLLATAFVLIIIYAIASRYLFGFSLIWIEEIVRFLLAWIVFLGVSVAFAERGHMAMIALNRAFPFRARQLLDAAFALLMIGFLAVLLNEGLKLAISVLPQVSPALQVSYFWAYLSMPVGAALAIVQLLFILCHRVKDIAAGTEPED